MNAAKHRNGGVDKDESVKWLYGKVTQLSLSCEVFNLLLPLI